MTLNYYTLTVFDLHSKEHSFLQFIVEYHKADTSFVCFHVVTIFKMQSPEYQT